MTTDLIKKYPENNAYKLSWNVSNWHSV